MIPDRLCGIGLRLPVGLEILYADHGKSRQDSTKMIATAVLGAKLNVLKTPENFNNDIGTPLTLLGLARSTSTLAVIETGMNHFGEIEYLGAMVRPDIAVISNIGPSPYRISEAAGRAF